jgi:hypothetical protein
MLPMPQLTRRRNPERPDCWHVYFGDVQAGTIARRIGNPHDTDQWEWRCGFYPGSHPGEHTSGTAATFEPTLVLSAHGPCSARIAPQPIFRRGAINRYGLLKNIGALTEASVCRRTGRAELCPGVADSVGFGR